MRRLTSILTLTVAAASFVGLAPSALAATKPFGAKSASQILSLASAAMLKAGSVHVVNNSLLSGSLAFTQTTDSSRLVGEQSQEFGSGVESIRLIGTALYLKANNAAYSQSFNIANSTLAGNWVKVPSSNPNYSNIAAAVLLPSLIKNVFTMRFSKVLGVKTFHGQATVAIKGDPPNTTPGTSEIQTVYISTSAPYLPVGLKTVFLEGVNGTGTILFSKWGEKFNVIKPGSYFFATSKNFP
jgi:hypothetical protein